MEKNKERARMTDTRTKEKGESRLTQLQVQSRNSNARPNQVLAEEESALNMNEQEEDLIYRMYRLVGERWDLIAGRIPGRSAEEIERFWRIKQRQNNNNNN
ncbi:hypothetical protein RND81_05G095600 [Saponaria officinalis]|uniref:Myb-like domain-containing protein n=1 Tax=Saponaria officinalis TaxID=3572 RepID=A0AAW1KW48_SAPOF